MNPKTYYIFTDGSSLGNNENAPAGAATLFLPLKKVFSQKLIGTNNFAELKAIDMSLIMIKDKVIETGDFSNYENIIIYSDSEYAINAVAGNNKAKKNAELIGKCIDLLKQIKEKIKVEFEHVDAHTGNSDWKSQFNDYVDKIARKRAKDQKNISND